MSSLPLFSNSFDPPPYGTCFYQTCDNSLFFVWLLIYIKKSDLSNTKRHDLLADCTELGR